MSDSSARRQFIETLREENRSLRGSIVEPRQLSAALRLRMFELLRAHFDGIAFCCFQRDLKSKDAVVLLRWEQSNVLAGFSTIEIFDHCFQGAPIRVLFSGDTIIDQRAWGSLELSRLWAEWALREQQRAPDMPLYWLLISKGIRTYRFLPTFYRRFYPAAGYETPSSVRALMDDLGSRRFGPYYDPARQIVGVYPGAYRLKPALAAVPEGRMRDAHVRYFLERNPNYHNGEELLCLAEVSRENLKERFTKRLAAPMRSRAAGGA